MTTDQYVAIGDVANFYSVSVSTVRTWIRTGKLTESDFLKLGNTYRFKITDVDAALRRASAGVTPEPTPAPAEVTADPSAPVQLELDFNNPDKDI
jgi:excisionase family DNA binding protein